MQDFDAATASKPNNVGPHYMGLSVRNGVLSAFYEEPTTTEGTNYVIHYRENPGGGTSIGLIERRGTDIEKAFDDLEGLHNKGLLPKELYDNALTELTFPSEIVVGGLKLAVGKPSAGEVVDAAEFATPETQKAFADGRRNYESAAWRSIDTGLVKPPAAVPAAAPKQAL